MKTVPDKGEKEKGAKTPKPGGKKKVLLLVLIAVLLLGGSAAGAYFFLAKPGKAQEAAVKKEKEKPVEVLDLGEILVNLTSNGLPRYMRVKIVLEYPQDKKLSEEIKKKKHQITDTTITFLRSKTISEVSSAGSVDALKRELMERINGQLESGRVTAVYFTDYLVQ